MKQHVVTIIMTISCVMICGVVAVFFSASLVSAAEMSTTSSTNTNRNIAQDNLGRAVISNVSRTASTSVSGKILTRVIRFTMTAESADVYVSTATTGRGSALVWQGNGVRPANLTLTSSATTDDGRFVVHEGEDKTFEITYTATNRPELNLQAIRFSNSVRGRLYTVPFPKASGVTPTRPVATTSNRYHTRIINSLINHRFTTQPCHFQNNTYVHGSTHPFYGNSESFLSNFSVVYACNNGVWESTPVPKTLPSQSSAADEASGMNIGTPSVRGASLSVPERQHQLMELHNQLSVLMSKVTKSKKNEGEFKIGDQIVTTDALKVRARGAGGVLGIQPAGAAGVITSTWVNVADRGWYKVDFATGVDGWVAASYLELGVPLDPITINFSRHRDTLATSTIIATEGMSEKLSPLSYVLSVTSEATNTSVAIEKLAVSLTITGAPFATVVDSATLVVNGTDFSDVIFTSTNGTVTTLVFNISEPIIVENQNEILAELQLVLKDTLVSLDQDVTIQAQVSSTDRALTDVAVEQAEVTFSGSATGDIHTIVVTE